MQDIKLSEATGDYARMGFTTVNDSDGKTLNSGTLSATARWVDADGTSTAVAGTFSQPDSTNAAGLRYYTPTAGELASKGAAWLYITGTAGGTTFRARQIQISVTALDKYDAVRAGLTALPNAAAEAAGGLYTRGTGAGQINQPANGMVDVNAVRHLGTAYAAPTVAGVPEVDITHYLGSAAPALVGGRFDASVGAMAANVITAAATAADYATEMAASIWNALTATYAAVGSFGKKLGDLAAGGDATAANQATIIGHVDTLEATVATILGHVDTEIAAIQSALIDIGGLMHRNSMIDNVVRDGNGFMLTARLRVWANAAGLAAATAAAPDNADGEIRRYTLTGTASSNRMATFKAAQIL